MNDTHHHGRHTFEWGDPERAILEVEYVRDHRARYPARYP